MSAGDTEYDWNGCARSMQVWVDHSCVHMFTCRIKFCAYRFITWDLYLSSNVYFLKLAAISIDSHEICQCQRAGIRPSICCGYAAKITIVPDGPPACAAWLFRLHTYFQLIIICFLYKVCLASITASMSWCLSLSTRNVKFKFKDISVAFCQYHSHLFWLVH